MEDVLIKNINHIAELISDFIFYWNVSTNEVFFSEKWKNYLGYEDAEIENSFEGFLSIIYSNEQENARTQLTDFIKNKESSYLVERKIKCKDGRIKWIVSKAKVIEWDDDGYAKRILGVCTDISQQKKIDQQLIDSEKRFRSLFKDHSAVMLLIDPDDGRIVDVNKSAVKFYGYTYTQLCSMNITEINGLPSYQVSKKMIEAKIEKKDTFIFPHKLATGEIRIVEVHSSKIAEGDKTLLFSIILDVTEKIKAENLLVEERYNSKLLESVVANANDGVIITEAEASDKTGRKIVYINDTMSKMTGYSKEELLGKTPSILQGPKTDIKELDRLKSALSKWERCEIEIINYKKSGDEFWVNISFFPLTDEKGCYTHWVSIQKDITERKKIQNQIRKLSQAVEQSSASIMITDTNANIEYVNDAFCKTTEYSYNEIIGTNARILKSELTSQSEQKKLHECLISKTEWHGEFCNKKKNGEVFWESAIITPIFNEEGIATNFVAIKENITEKKRLASDLNEKLRVIEVAQKVANIGYFLGYMESPYDINNINFSKWEASPTLYGIMGIDSTFKGNFLNEWLKLIQPQYREIVLNTYVNALTQKTNINLSVIINRLNDNEERWIKFLGQFEYDESGKTYCIILYIQDITELEKLLLERQRIINSITDYFYALDQNLNFVLFNEPAKKLLKVNERQLVGKNIYESFPILLETPLKDNLTKAIQSGESVLFEFFIKETNQWYEQKLYPSNGGCTTFFRSITNRKEAEKEIIKANEELKIKTEELLNSNTELERFAYVASHDLQEPLRMVTSFLQLFEKKYGSIVDETGKKYIHFAVDGAQRMKTLIQDLLQYSRAGSGALDITSVDLNTVLKDVIHLFTNDIYEIDAEIKICKMPVVEANKSAMTQLLQNLIANSLKYKSTEKPIIEICAEENETEWIICVKDNGIGIEPQYAEKIFILFQRLHNKEEYSGTGIGLAVCKKIVERYKGKIWVESELGRGATFKFTIPKTAVLI